MAIPTPSAAPGGNRSNGQYQRRNNDPFANIRRNHRIKVPQVRVISPEGKQLGILDTPKAVNLALEVGLDLVEVAPNATPPVCRIMDFGKYVYEESKKTPTRSRPRARSRRSSSPRASRRTTSTRNCATPRNSWTTATR
jgi:translation initiation factor IF-3